MGLSKAERRELEVDGAERRAGRLRNEIAKLIEEYPELVQRLASKQQRGSTETESEVTRPRPDPEKPTINDQALLILSRATGPMLAGAVFEAMQKEPHPATANITSVHTGMAQLTHGDREWARRTEKGYVITAKGRRRLEQLQPATATPTGGPA